jgi:hypothetical protein
MKDDRAARASTHIPENRFDMMNEATTQGAVEDGSRCSAGSENTKHDVTSKARSISRFENRNRFVKQM